MSKKCILENQLSKEHSNGVRAIVGFRDTAPITEYQTERNMKHEMEAGVMKFPKISGSGNVLNGTEIARLLEILVPLDYSILGSSLQSSYLWKPPSGRMARWNVLRCSCKPNTPNPKPPIPQTTLNPEPPQALIQRGMKSISSPKAGKPAWCSRLNSGFRV